MFQKPDVQPVIVLARAAGDILMRYRGRVMAEYKGDNSPVTQADKDSSALIIRGLQKQTPHIPVVSEEQSMDINRRIVRDHETYWVTDPLDGTKSYIDGYDGFGVHIALIHKGEPVMGIAYFPAQEDGAGKLYYTGNNGKAYMKSGRSSPMPLQLKKPSGPLKVAMGWKDSPFTAGIELVRAVGGARLCVTAEGLADIGQFNSLFSYWDVAAGHAILKAAGGDFLDIKNGRPVRYADPSLVTPPALAGRPQTLRRYIKTPALKPPHP